MSKYKLVLGLEIHMHVKTNHKMFCFCNAAIYDAKPNTHVCPVCLGLPGALPVPNGDAIYKTQLLGLAMGCVLEKNTRFDRKHYFYHDLPKGYQISQYKKPFCIGIDGILERIHLEEDTAKSVHMGGSTLVDFNKSGMPLIELVTKPVFTSGSDAANFARKLRDIARYLNVSDCDMEKGQMRIEPNISIRTAEMEERNELPSYKVEIKNINSFKNMEKAIEYEIERQSEILDLGDTPIQENRGWDDVKNTTVSQREKEEAHDYRYFPEADIPPFEYTEEQIEDIQRALPELPAQKMQRYVEQFNITPTSAEALTTGDMLMYISKFEELAQSTDAQKAANLLINKPDIRELSVEKVKEIIDADADKIDDSDYLMQVSHTVVTENPDVVESYKLGKTTTIQFLIGQVMKKTKGKADPILTQKILESML